MGKDLPRDLRLIPEMLEHLIDIHVVAFETCRVIILAWDEAGPEFHLPIPKEDR